MLNALFVFLALLGALCLSVAIGVLLRFRFGGEEINDADFRTWAEHRDRPARCICPPCRAWRVKDARRRATGVRHG